METSKRAPAFQLYPQDFISSLDVQLMTAAEVGAYCLLLFNSWTQPKQGYLPNDEALLRQISRLSAEEWKASKKRLLAKFLPTPDKKQRYNPRLVAEADKHASFRERQVENGKRGGRPRREETQPPPLAFAGETQNNPGLSQAFSENNPEKGLHTSTSSSTSSSIDDVLTGAADAAPPGPEDEIAEDQPSEKPGLGAPQTEGGAADVGTLKTTRGSKWQPPSEDEVLAYFLEKRPDNHAAAYPESLRFVAYYQSNGWKVGRNPMKDWQAAARNWLTKVPEKGGTTLAGPAPYANTLPVPPYQRQPQQSQVSQRQQVLAAATAKLLGQ